MFNSFLTGFLTKTVAQRRRGRPARRTSPIRRLKLECLENRLTLSGSPVIVTTGADSGPGSLRAAIGSAVSGETIEFASNVHSIKLTSGDLPIVTNLNIIGPGANRLSISGNNASRVFDVASGKTVTIANLTIADGMVNTPLESSPNVATWGGGGILNEAGATLTLVNDTLNNNQALGVNGQDEFGGGLFNMGNAIVSGCNFTNNQVLGAGSYDAIGGSAGGAIDNYGGASLTVAKSLFSNNSVVSTDGLYYFALGGAVENNAGVNGWTTGQAAPSTAILTDCKFLDNLAQAGAQALSNGGAILNEGLGSSMTITGCQISGNRAVGGKDGIKQSGQALGGGVMNAYSMVIADCTITDNQAVGGDNGNPLQNPWNGGGFGGGVCNDNGVLLTITDSVIGGNIAQGGTNTSGPGSDGFGGGIMSNGAPGNMTVTDSQISNNMAIGGLGGAGTAIGTIGAAGFGFGGGIDTSGNAISTLVGCTITGNVAQGGAGTNGNNGGDGVGGGLGVSNQGLNGYATSSQLTIIDCAIVGNQAVGGTGGQGANGGDGLGGGLVVLNGGTATLTDSSVQKNDALGGEEGKGHGGTDGQGVGGGIYIFDLGTGTFTFDPTTNIKKNFASTSNNNIFSS